MLHLGISSARNQLALRESLHSRIRSGIRILVTVSATSKCRGLIPQFLFYPGVYIGARPEHIRRRERRSGRKGPVLPFDPRGPRQSEGIADKVSRYEQSLASSDLPNIPFHSELLLNGHGPYEGIDLQTRKKMLYSFNVLVQCLPVSYRTFVYRRSEFEDLAKLTSRMKRDISGLLFDRLEFFQSFDEVKVYYDNGQDIVKHALDQSIGFVLSKGVVERRKTSMTDYRLEQAADYLCTIELAAVKYAAKEDGETYNKFFGGIGTFKKNWPKQARRKMIK